MLERVLERSRWKLFNAIDVASFNDKARAGVSLKNCTIWALIFMTHMLDRGIRFSWRIIACSSQTVSAKFMFKYRFVIFRTDAQSRKVTWNIERILVRCESMTLCVDFDIESKEAAACFLIELIVEPPSAVQMITLMLILIVVLSVMLHLRQFKVFARRW